MQIKDCLGLNFLYAYMENAESMSMTLKQEDILLVCLSQISFKVAAIHMGLGAV